MDHVADRLADEDRGVVDDAVVEPSGNVFFSRSIIARTSADACERVDAGQLEDAEGDRRLVVEQAAQRVAVRAELDARRRRASRVICPSASARTTMSANWSSVVSRPCVLIVNWNVVSVGTGGSPSRPAATCTFCSRIARTTSLAVSSRAASLSGSSQTRML